MGYKPKIINGKSIANWIGIRPRGKGEKGGILCLPMEKNIPGNVKEKHQDWELIKCEKCGCGCWKKPECDKLVESQGVQLLCTECAIRAGIAYRC